MEGGDRERREKDRSEDTGKRTKRIGVRDRNFEAMFAKIVNLLVGAHTCIGTVPFYFGSRFSLSLSLSHIHIHTYSLSVSLSFFVCIAEREKSSQECLSASASARLSPTISPLSLVSPFQRAVSIRGCRWHLLPAWTWPFEPVCDCAQAAFLLLSTPRSTRPLPTLPFVPFQNS